MRRVQLYYVRGDGGYVLRESYICIYKVTCIVSAPWHISQIPYVAIFFFAVNIYRLSKVEQWNGIGRIRTLERRS